MKNRYDKPIPLLTLDGAGRYLLSDDGERWVIEEVLNHDDVRIYGENEAQVKCNGSKKIDIIIGIRNLDIDVTLSGRKSLTAFWEYYVDYRRELAATSWEALKSEFDHLSLHAEPMEEEYLFSSNQFKNMRAKRYSRSESKELALGERPSRRYMMLSSPSPIYVICLILANCNGQD